MGSTPGTILQSALLIIGIGLFLIGALLIRRSWFPRRNGQTQHCKKCTYNLEGIKSDRCPECGQALIPTNIIKGQRLRRPTLAAFASLLVLIGIAFAILSQSQRIRQFDWYNYKPTSWVITDLKSSDSALHDRAWKELTARLANKKLSPQQEGELKHAAIEIISRPKIAADDDVLTYLYDSFSELSQSQQDLIFDRLLRGIKPPARSFANLDALRIAFLEKHNLISQSQIDRLLEVALQAQIAPSTYSEINWLMTELGDRAAVNTLSPTQRERFFNQATNPSLAARTEILAGEPLPYKIEMNGYGPNQGWSSTNRLIDVLVDDKTVLQGGGHGWALGLSSGAGGSQVDFNVPGKHVLKVILELAAFPSEKREPEVSAVWRKTFTLSAPFTVLPANTQPKPAIDPDPAEAESLRSTITFEHNNFSGDRAAVTVVIKKPPVNVAFKVFAILDGKEYEFGEVAAKAGESHGFMITSPKEFPTKGPSKIVTLILRSNEAAARKTVDLYKIWKGELTFPNIPLAYPADVNKF